MMAKIFGELGESASMTIGSDETTSKDIETMGSAHVKCQVSDMVVDEDNNLVSTPAYMEAQSIKDAADGIEKLVKQVLSMIK